MCSVRSIAVPPPHNVCMSSICRPDAHDKKKKKEKKKAESAAAPTPITELPNLAGTRRSRASCSDLSSRSITDVLHLQSTHIHELS